MSAPYRITNRVAAMAESVTLAIDAKAKAMIAEGIDVVNFGAGEPDFDTPENVKAAARKALDGGKTKYAPAPGLMELRQALAEKFQKDNNLPYKASQISVNVGGKHSLYNAFMTLVDKGDEVIIPAPYWVSYVEMVRGAEATPVIVETTAASEFRITPAQLEAAITPATRIVIINSPSNPTGSAYTPDELRALAEVIVKHDLFCISDELYEKLLYDGAEFVSMAALPGMFERTLTVNGFSKAYSMTGWRLGYCAGPEPLIKAINTLQSHSTSNATTFAQYGALEALRGPQDALATMRSAFNERRLRMLELLRAIPGVTVPTPQGAFYAFPDFGAYHGKTTPGGKVIEGSLDLAEYLLVEGKVGVVPGAAFGSEGNQRLSYACSMENIEKGVARIAEALAKLK